MIVTTNDVVMCSFVSLLFIIVILLVYDLRFPCESLVWLELKHWLKNTGSASLPVFLASVLILVIVDENNSSHAV